MDDELVFLGARRPERRERTPPDPVPAGAVIRPTVASTCDMDELALAGVVRFREPAPLGHEAIGIAEEIGQDIIRCVVGDRVVIPLRIATIVRWSGAVEAVASPLTKLELTR